MKRTLSLVLALVLAFCLSAFALAEERETLTILMEQDTYVEDYETNAFTKMIEDQFNVNLDFELLPAGEAADKLNIMLASGQELPDIINYRLDINAVTRYAEDGCFIPLNDYYAQEDTNVNKIAQEHPTLYASITTPSGDIYSLPEYLNAMHDEVRYKIWINTKWLENLGLEMPTTTEEFYNVLKAFKEQDPNGNGIADEYALVGSASTWSGDPTINLMNAFIQTNDVDNLIVTDGVVDVAYNKEGWKEGIKYLKRLVSEELLAPLSFTQDTTQFRGMANNEGDCIVGAFTYSSCTLLDVASNPYYQDYVGLEPLAGPEGVRFAAYSPTNVGARWFISADCDNPDLAFAIGDFLFDPTEEVTLKARFGIEGEHWSRPTADAIPSYVGIEPKVVQDVNIWNVAQNAHWRNNAPLYGPTVYQAIAATGDTRIGDIVMKYQALKPAEGTYATNLIFTTEESEQISDIQSTLKTYVNECKTRFIMGDMDIDTEWDSYVAELEKIGLAKWLEIAQKVYDRMYK